MQAAGPVGNLIETDGSAVKPRVGYQLADDANALTMLYRVAFPEFDRDGNVAEISKNGGGALLRWASEKALGQDIRQVKAVAARREQALLALRAAGHTVVRLHAEPLWRLAVGLGNQGNAHEIGLSLHGTYGWPVIPGSSLKGLAARWAMESDPDSKNLDQIFGTPRRRPRRADGGPGTPEEESDDRLGDGLGGGLDMADAARGSVRFLDAIPAGTRVRVTVDVLTPHVKPYYDTTAKDSRRDPVPPAEHHNPVPVKFLTVSGAFAVDLYGPEDDVRQAAKWLTKAADELGAGAKTAAGYGYLKLTQLRDKGTAT
jgi:CRISPR-associated protein Cmr6